MMQDYVVFVQRGDGGLSIVNFFDDEATAREYARIKTRDSKKKYGGSWNDTFYACKILKGER
jgi:hypothetical protein